jgi:xanthine dehydrogenase YagT iron-sulfur-binding subunit
MDDQRSPESGPRFSRRGFLAGLGATSVGAIAGNLAAQQGAPSNVFPPGLHEITLTINGEARKLQVEPRTTLLDALRDKLDLTGAKKICDRGACGGCTVLLDDQPINSCLMLAMDAVGSKLRTVEGLAKGDELHPVQAAFVQKDALQCGFCTPGMIMASVACVEQHKNPDRARIRECISGNICRCGTYTRIVDAVQDAAAKMGGK